MASTEDAEGIREHPPTAQRRGDAQTPKAYIRWSWDSVERVAKILSIIAIPLVLGILGLLINNTIAKREIGIAETGSRIEQAKLVHSFMDVLLDTSVQKRKLTIGLVHYALGDSARQLISLIAALDPDSSVKEHARRVLSLYPYLEPPTITRLDPKSVDENPPIKDVVKEFENISLSGSQLAFKNEEQIRWPRYTANIDNNFGLNNHFQGIQRLRNKNQLVLSGGDPHEPASHIFIVEMSSQKSSVNWKSNITSSEEGRTDRIIYTIRIDSKFWHAGGISLLGDILAVPINDTKTAISKIVFFSLSDRYPKRINLFVEKQNKSRAAALAKLSNSRYLLGILTYDASYTNRFEFHVSRSKDFNDGFEPIPLFEGDKQRNTLDDYQAINFVNQEDGRLYLIGTHNTSDASPTISGRNRADLYEVVLPETIYTNNPYRAEIGLTKIRSIQFRGDRNNYNMDAASGVYIDSTGSLLIYSTFHWLSDDYLKFTQFSSEVSDSTHGS